MHSIYWTALQNLNELSQFMQNELASLLENCQQSTFWIGHTYEVAVAAIAIQETKNEVLVEVRIPDADSQTLDVELTQETALVLGKWAVKTEVEGYLNPGRFQSFIPLPYPVHPESVLAEFKDDVLRLRLLKQPSITHSMVQSRVMVDVGGRLSVILSLRYRE
ncbi:MAG: Hsp20/alpha crystallin family protein [Oscillatoria princeps RMCB-10]|jgi:HSP20 family molecular chaperone IbpA|nr:Hsp20/alpha crystallin family protein [Oscillatoria princeps RMCB-10]